MRMCSECRNLLSHEAKFCARCGTAVAQSPPPPAKPPIPANPAPLYSPPSYTPPPQSGESDETQVLPPDQQTPYTPAYQPIKPSPQPFAPPGSPVNYQQKAQPVPFSNTASRVKLSEAMQYPFASSNWLATMVIGGLLIFLPIIGLIAVNGYIVEIIRRVANDDYDVLPGWDDFGTKIKDGSVMLVLLLIWAFLPFLILSAPGYLLLYAGQDDIGAPLAVIGTFLGTFATYFFLPIVWGRYAVTNQFSAGLQVGEIWAQVQNNFGRYIGNWLLAGLMLFISLIAIWIFGTLSITLMVLLIGLCIMPFTFAISFYATLIQAHLMGQLYRIVMCGRHNQRSGYVSILGRLVPGFVRKPQPPKRIDEEKRRLEEEKRKQENKKNNAKKMINQIFNEKYRKRNLIIIEVVAILNFIIAILIFIIVSRQS